MSQFFQIIRVQIDSMYIDIEMHRYVCQISFAGIYVDVTYSILNVKLSLSVREHLTHLFESFHKF